MNRLQLIISIIILALGVWLTRFLPFIIFKNTKKLPKIVDYLGKVLPAAMMGLLVVYCAKDYCTPDIKAILPALLAAGVTAAAHLIKHNTVLSITLGTAIYMILIRMI